MIFHHIGIATKNIEKELANYKAVLNIKSISDIVNDPLQHARLCMIILMDGTHLELVEGKPVQEYVKKGIKLYHICFKVEDIYNEIETMQKDKAILVSEPLPAPLFNNKKVAFMFTKIGLVELLEA